MGSTFDLSNLGAGARSAIQTVLLITAGGTYPVRVRDSSIEITDNATSFQLHGHWQKVSSFSPTPAGRGVTTITKTNAVFGAAGFTVIGDIDAEPVYDAAVIREAHSGPSVIGYHSHQGGEPEEVIIMPGDSWGLVIPTAPAASIFLANAMVEEG